MNGSTYGFGIRSKHYWFIQSIYGYNVKVSYTKTHAVAPAILDIELENTIALLIDSLVV